jgi:hypothetical protein
VVRRWSTVSSGEGRGPQQLDYSFVPSLGGIRHRWNPLSWPRAFEQLPQLILKIFQPLNHFSKLCLCLFITDENVKGFRKPCLSFNKFLLQLPVINWHPTFRSLPDLRLRILSIVRVRFRSRLRKSTTLSIIMGDLFRLWFL